MIQFKVTRVGKVKFPDIKLDKRTLEEMGKISSKAVRINIKSQKQADGTALKRNAPSTRARKRKRGLVARSLIDIKRRFIRAGRASWNWRTNVSRETVTIIPASQDLRRLMGYVQDMGYVGWFGLSGKARNEIRAVLRKYVKRKFRRAGFK